MNFAKRQHEVQSRQALPWRICIANNARAYALMLAYCDMMWQSKYLAERGLQAYPGEANFETLLAISRAELDLKQREDAEREEFRKRKDAQAAVVDSPDREDPEAAELLQSSPDRAS